MKIFSGSSCQNLARKIANKLNQKLGKIELSEFSNSEVRVFIKEKIANHQVFIVQSLSIPCEKHLLQLCLIADAVKRQGAKEITAIIPWLAYSKQDKVFRPGEPLSAKVIAKIIQSAPFDKIVTFDLHNIAIAGFFDVSVIHLSALPILKKALQKKITAQSQVVSIGVGGSKLSSDLAKYLKLPLAYFDSQRDLETGKVTVNNISQDVTGRDAVIIDDMISTGSTLIEAANFLKSQKVKSLTIAATHHLFVPGVSEKLEKSPIDNLFITDTVQKPKGLKLKKTKIVSISPLVAEYIIKNF